MGDLSVEYQAQWGGMVRISDTVGGLVRILGTVGGGG